MPKFEDPVVRLALGAIIIFIISILLTMLSRQ